MNDQPSFKLIYNLGDVNPLLGGALLFQDQTHTYSPELEIIDEMMEDQFLVSRINLDQCYYTQGNDEGERRTVNPTLDGVLSDNPYHLYMPAWFADKLEEVADSMGTAPETLIEQLSSTDPIQRAQSYLDLIQYFGTHEFDQYPLTLTEEETQQRINKHLATA